jgi:hypothetical protein
MKIKARFVVLLALILVMGLTAGAAFAQDTSGDDDGGSRADSAVCSGEKQHPVIQGIADTYGASYEEVLGYFCDGSFGLGEIMLAYETANATGGSVGDLLGQKGQGNGWGKVWKELGLIGNERDGGPPPWAGRGKPEWAGSHGNGNGGKPEDKGNGNPNGENPNGNDNPGQGNGNGNGNGQGNNGNGNSGDSDNTNENDNTDTSGDGGGSDS